MPNTTNAPAARTRRWFVRCLDCFSVYALDMDRVPEGHRTLSDGRRVYCVQAECACGGAVEVMGFVRRSEEQRLLAEEQRCPCDQRCTGARGPICDCPCGGQNHGSHALVTIVKDVGPVPRLSGDPDAAALAVAAEWREGLAKALATIETRHAPVLEAKRAGRYYPGYGAYLALRADQVRVVKARKARTHRARMGWLQKVLAEPAPAPAPVSILSAPLVNPAS